MTDGSYACVIHVDSEESKSIPWKLKPGEKCYSWSRGCDHLILRPHNFPICIRQRGNFFYPSPDPAPIAALAIDDPSQRPKDVRVDVYGPVRMKGLFIWQSGRDYIGANYFKPGDRYFDNTACTLLILKENDLPLCLYFNDYTPPVPQAPPPLLSNEGEWSNQIFLYKEKVPLTCNPPPTQYEKQSKSFLFVCHVYNYDHSKNQTPTFNLLNRGDRYYDDPKIKGDCNHFIVKENGMKICVHTSYSSSSSKPILASTFPSDQVPVNLNPVSVNPSITTSSGSSWSTWLQSATEGSSPTTVLLTGALAATGTYLAYKTYKWFMGKREKKQEEIFEKENQENEKERLSGIQKKIIPPSIDKNEALNHQRNARKIPTIPSIPPLANKPQHPLTVYPSIMSEKSNLERAKQFPSIYPSIPPSPFMTGGNKPIQQAKNTLPTLSSIHSQPRQMNNFKGYQPLPPSPTLPLKNQKFDSSSMIGKVTVQNKNVNNYRPAPSMHVPPSQAINRPFQQKKEPLYTPYSPHQTNNIPKKPLYTPPKLNSPPPPPHYKPLFFPPLRQAPNQREQAYLHYRGNALYR